MWHVLCSCPLFNSPLSLPPPPPPSLLFCLLHLHPQLSLPVHVYYCCMLYTGLFWTHTHARTHARMRSHTHMCAQIHTHARTHAPACMRVCTCARAHTHMCVLPYMHTHTCAYSHTCTHTHTNTHTHTHRGENKNDWPERSRVLFIGNIHIGKMTDWGESDSCGPVVHKADL